MGKMIQDSLRVHLVGVETERIENKRKKSEEKNNFIGIWLERIGGWKIGGVQIFSSLTHQFGKKIEE